MQLKVLNIKGKEVKSIDVPDSIFDVPLNDHVLYSVAKAYRANRRQGTHATKTRAFVRGGGKKPFRQKGTGNARQGTSRSPLFPGGAVVLGPQPRDYREKINKKLKTLALKVALSDKARNGKLIVLDSFEAEKYSTKHVVSAFAALGVSTAVVTDEASTDILYKSVRNIHGAYMRRPAEVNAEDLLRYESFVISENGLEALKKRIGSEK